MGRKRGFALFFPSCGPKFGPHHTLFPHSNLKEEIMKKLVTLFLTLVVLASAFVMPVEAREFEAGSNNGNPGDDTPPIALVVDNLETGVCVPQWPTLSSILSPQSSQEPVLGMPEPHILAAVGIGRTGGLAFHHGESGSGPCIPGARCVQGQPHCRCKMVETGCVPAHTDEACVRDVLRACSRAFSTNHNALQMCLASSSQKCHRPKRCQGAEWVCTQYGC